MNKKSIDKIINECLSNLIEVKIDAKTDKVVNNAQKRVHDYMKGLVKSGDKNANQIMRDKGFQSSLNSKELQQKLDDINPDSNISQELNQDVIDTAKLLRNYTNDKGGINFEKLKSDYPNDYNTIIRMKNFIDLKGLTRMYDKSANPPSHSYGINWKGDENIDDLDFNSISDAEAKKYRQDKMMSLGMAKQKMKASVIDRYMKSKYGVNLDVPNITFSNGNKKIPENTLIINFTTAIGCPAWNECLVKHACYARQTEKGKPSVYDGNDRRSLFWLMTQHDEQLLSLMMDFARSYCFDYTKIAKDLINQGLVKGKMQPQNLAIKISKMQLTDSFFTSEIIEVMKQYKRIDYIRLNENGDFIGQWLVDAWDAEAGKYQSYGINVSAYTCRHLNYEGIKNIILNTSFKGGKGNIARHFIAIPEEIYNALDETYGGNNNQLVLNNGSVQPSPQPLYNSDSNGNLTPNGKMYYKCPCDREFGGDDKISCYQCSLCYQPKSDNSELFVFVKAHGAASTQLKGYDLIGNNIGVSRNFLTKYQKPKSVAESDNRSNAMLKMVETDGINGVATNAINSTYNHFMNLGKVNESIKKCKNLFVENYNRFFKNML